MAIEGDGFYASVFPSGSEQPTGKRFLNASVIEAFFAVQQAEVVLADAISAWDQADAWSTDGALNASAWLRNKLGVSDSHAHWIVSFARKTEFLAPTVREAVGSGVLSTDKAKQMLHHFTKKRLSMSNAILTGW